MSKITFCLVFFILAFTAQALPIADINAEEEVSAEPKEDVLVDLAAGVAHGILNAGHEAVDLTAGILGDEENKDAELENVPAVINDQENDDDILLELFHHAAHAAIDLAHHAVDLTTDLLSDEQNKDAKVEAKATEKTE